MTAKKTVKKTTTRPARKAMKAKTAIDADLITGPPSANPPGFSNPALRALKAIGVTRISQLTAHRESDVAALHGMGPKAVTALKAALKARGTSFSR